MISVAIMAHRRHEAWVQEMAETLAEDAMIAVVEGAETLEIGRIEWARKQGDLWDTRRRSLLAFDPAATHHLVLQDDAIVCRDLVAGVETALGAIPAQNGTPSPLCLYLGKVRPHAAHVDQLVAQTTERTRWIRMAGMHWGVGVVIPTGLIPLLVQWGDHHPEIAAEDKRMSKFFSANKIPVWYPWPSLVDHRDGPRLAGLDRGTGRVAHKFIGADQARSP